jgi:hypothetical protein
MVVRDEYLLRIERRDDALAQTVPGVLPRAE